MAKSGPGRKKDAQKARKRYSILGQEIEDRASPPDAFALWQSDPFRQWLRSISDPLTRARIDYALTKMAQGLFGDWKPGGDGVREMRLDYGPGYRIYYRQIGRQILLLLGGGDKRTQPHDIQAAEKLWKAIKDDMDELQK